LLGSYNRPMSMFRPRRAALVVVALALFIDTFLYYLLVPLLPAFARAFHLSQIGVGILFGGYAVSLLAATFPMGQLADRIGRKAPMLWGLLGLGASTLLFAFAQHFWLLVLARILQGLSATATWTAGMALLADHFPAESRGRAMGTVFAFANLGVLVGPPVSGYLSQHFGPRAPFLLGVALVLLDAAARAFLIKELPGSRGYELDFRSLLGNRTVRVFAGAMALGAGMWALLESVLPLHFDRVMKLSASQIGLFFGAAALAHMSTSPLMGGLSDRIGRKRVLIIGLVLALFLIPLPALFHRVSAVIVVMMGLGVTASFIMSPVSPAMADAVDKMGSAQYGTVFALINFAYALGTMVGPLAGSVGVEVFGLQITLLIAGLCFGAYSLSLRRINA
jgi:MFS transporter, DHA1 family, solute carrier family 18 (vesicular amine transporter), member 1/2